MVSKNLFIALNYWDNKLQDTKPNPICCFGLWSGLNILHRLLLYGPEVDLSLMSGIETELSSTKCIFFYKIWELSPYSSNASYDYSHSNPPTFSYKDLGPIKNDWKEWNRFTWQPSYCREKYGESIEQ